MIESDKNSCWAFVKEWKVMIAGGLEQQYRTQAQPLSENTSSSGR